MLSLYYYIYSDIFCSIKIDKYYLKAQKKLVIYMAS